MRSNGRRPDQIRPLVLDRGWSKHAEGSVLVSAGDTRVLCTASVEESVPPFLKGRGKGWLTAEYGMLPRSTNTRMRREAAEGAQSGRTHEIQRLIGRSLRAVADLPALLTLFRADGTSTPLAPVSPPAYEFHRSIVRLLRDGTPMRITSAQSRDVVALMEAAEQSALENGRPVTPSLLRG